MAPRSETLGDKRWLTPRGARPALGEGAGRKSPYCWERCVNRWWPRRTRWRALGLRPHGVLHATR